MITVKLKGGLGNQMFQYAFGRKLSLKRQEILKLDKSLLQWSIRQKIIGTIVREYELGEFNIKAELIKDKGKNYLEGFWQSEEYFKDIRPILLKDFTLKKKTNNFLKLKKLVSETNSVGIHFRRGDYVKRAVTGKYHGVLNFDYYRKAIEIINEKIKNPHFFVFSDDILWVKKNFITKQPVTFIGGSHKLTNPEELILMSYCRNNIIANSSFSWWGAWLNRNRHKIVLAPKRWFRKKRAESGIVPRTWIKVENSFS
ncbi:MAG: alpha-1,2-fucosyltransferase [bacterium]